MKEDTQAELIKDFVDFLKSHEMVFNYVYKKENGDPKKIFAVFSHPQGTAHIWLTICLEHDEFKKVIINKTRLAEVLTLLNEADIKSIVAFVNNPPNNPPYKKITFEIEQWLMGITINQEVIALDQSDNLFTELLEAFRKNIKSLNDEKVPFVITKKL
jgi:hypothetical protein